MKWAMTLIVLLFVGVVCRSSLPDKRPGYGNLDFRPDVGLSRRALSTVAVMAAEWEVEDYGLFMVATHEGSKLVAHPLSGGKWQNLP